MKGNPAVPAPQTSSSRNPGKRWESSGSSKGSGKRDKTSKGRSQSPKKVPPCYAYSRGHCLAGNQCSMSHAAIGGKQKEARYKWEQERLKAGKPLSGYGPKANGPSGRKYKPATGDAAAAQQGGNNSGKKKKNTSDSRSSSNSSASSTGKSQGKGPSTIVCRYTKNGGMCKLGDACKSSTHDKQVRGTRY